MKKSTKPTVHKFEVIVQPFLNVIEGNVTINKVKHSFSLQYTETDEWIGFDVDGKNFDLHIQFDEELTVSIYDVFENEKGDSETNTLEWHKVNLLLELSEGRFIKYKDAVKLSSKKQKSK